MFVLEQLGESSRWAVQDRAIILRFCGIKTELDGLRRGFIRGLQTQEVEDVIQLGLCFCHVTRQLRDAVAMFFLLNAEEANVLLVIRVIGGITRIFGKTAVRLSCQCTRTLSISG